MTHCYATLLLLLGLPACDSAGVWQDNLAAEKETSEPPQAQAPEKLVAATPTVPNLDPACVEHCAKVATLNCPNYPTPACIQDCVRLGQLPVCKAESQALRDCTLAAPASQFECDTDGVAAVKQGTCRAEEDKMLACVDGQIVKNAGAR